MFTASPAVLMRRQKGFTLIEVMLSLMIMTLALLSIIEFTSQQSIKLRASAEAQYLVTLTNAAQSYIAGKQADLAKQITTLGDIKKIEIFDAGSPKTLEGAGFLPNGVEDTSPSGLGYALYVKYAADRDVLPKPKTGPQTQPVFEGLVYADKHSVAEMPDDLLSQISLMGGPSLGYVQSLPMRGRNKGDIVSPVGAWAFSRGDWQGPNGNPAPGYPVGYTPFAGNSSNYGNNQDDIWLARVDLGDKKYNTMTTDMFVDGKNIIIKNSDPKNQKDLGSIQFPNGGKLYMQSWDAGNYRYSRFTVDEGELSLEQSASQGGVSSPSNYGFTLQDSNMKMSESNLDIVSGGNLKIDTDLYGERRGALKLHSQGDEIKLWTVHENFTENPGAALAVGLSPSRNTGKEAGNSDYAFFIKPYCYLGWNDFIYHDAYNYGINSYNNVCLLAQPSDGGIGALKITGGLVVDGVIQTPYSAYSGGIWSNQSDRRSKENIRPMAQQNNLAKLLKMEGVTFRFKDSKDKKQHMGFIAQDVQKLFPLAVEGDEKKEGSKLFMNYSGLLAPTVEAMKEFYKLFTDFVAEMRKKLSHITERLNKEEARMQAVEKQLHTLKQENALLKKELQALKQKRLHKKPHKQLAVAKG